jgi:hypothetical protein
MRRNHCNNSWSSSIILLCKLAWCYGWVGGSLRGLRRIFPRSISACMLSWDLMKSFIRQEGLSSLARSCPLVVTWIDPGLFLVEITVLVHLFYYCYICCRYCCSWHFFDLKTLISLLCLLLLHLLLKLFILKIYLLCLNLNSLNWLNNLKFWVKVYELNIINLQFI